MDNLKLTELFGKAKQATKVSTFQETKDLFVSSIGVKKPMDIDLQKTHVLTLKISMIMIGMVSILGIVLYLFSPRQPFVNGNYKTINKQEWKRETIVHQRIEEQTSQESKSTNVELLPLIKLKKLSTGSMKSLLESVEQNLDFPKESKQIRSFTYFQNNDYHFPVLTDKEIKENNKRKKNMIKGINKMMKSQLLISSSGNYTYEGKQYSISAFGISPLEVSNFQYRIFLFDLLISDRKNDFLMAKPEQNKWTDILNEGMKPMEEMYFSHPAYNNYPVVNVPPKGAELFCTWLSQNMAESYPESKFQEFRIPKKEEWLYAATMAGKNKVYPWGTDKIYNENGCFLANFNGEGIDTTKMKNDCFPTILEGGKRLHGFSSDGAMHTARIFSYNPNEVGLFNLSGNVAELVYIHSSKEFGTCGGGWLNTADELKLNAPDPYEGKVETHPNIGFRFVSTYEKK